MDRKTPEKLRAPAPDRNLSRQIVFSAAALCVMAAGVWTLMNMRAPYHPDVYSDSPMSDEDVVSRDGTSGLLGVNTLD